MTAKDRAEEIAREWYARVDDDIAGLAAAIRAAIAEAVDVAILDARAAFDAAKAILVAEAVREERDAWRAKLSQAEATIAGYREQRDRDPRGTWYGDD